MLILLYSVIMIFKMIFRTRKYQFLHLPIFFERFVILYSNTYDILRKETDADNSSCGSMLHENLSIEEYNCMNKDLIKNQHDTIKTDPVNIMKSTSCSSDLPSSVDTNEKLVSDSSDSTGGNDITVTDESTNELPLDKNENRYSIKIIF